MSSTLLRRAATSTLVVLCLLLTLTLPGTPAAAMTGTITGKLADSVTKAPIQGAEVYLGIPGAYIWAHTAVDGSFTIDLTPIQYNPSTPWQVYFVKPGYVTTPTNKFFMTTSGYVFGSDPANVPNPFPLVKLVVGPRATCTDPGTGNPNPPAVTSTVYLPNITRRLGGPDGFYTPFIIQNTGSTNTELEVSFYKFTDGSCVERYLIFNMAPGTSHANNPNDTVLNPTLPDDAQFSVVVQSFGSKIVGVVNEHQADPQSAQHARALPIQVHVGCHQDLQAGLSHGARVSLKTARKPRKTLVSDVPDVLMTLFDEVGCHVISALGVIRADDVILARIPRPKYIVSQD